MTARTCDAPGCKQPHHAHGYCSTHAARLKRGGDLETPLRKRDSATQTYTLEERLRQRTTVEDRGYATECWIYHGNKSTVKTDGSWYARVKIGPTMVGVHLASFREFVRPLDPGEQVHHKCDAKPCWRPEHLEGLTRWEHSRRHRGHSPDGRCLIRDCGRLSDGGWGLCGRHYQYFRKVYLRA